MLPCPLVRSWDREFFLGGIAVRQIALQRPSKTYHPWQRQKNTRRETRASYYHKLQRLVGGQIRLGCIALLHSGVPMGNRLNGCFATCTVSFIAEAACCTADVITGVCYTWLCVCVCVCVCERTFRDPCWNVMWYIMLVSSSISSHFAFLHECC